MNTQQAPHGMNSLSSSANNSNNELFASFEAAMEDAAAVSGGGTNSAGSGGGVPAAMVSHKGGEEKPARPKLAFPANASGVTGGSTVHNKPRAGGNTHHLRDPSTINCHCLVVEDNIVLHRILSRWFENLKIGCTHCFDGAQAVEKCKLEKYSLIFMDVAMPGMNGIEAARVIRAEGRNRTTPIVAFSALDSSANLFDVGINAYLKKPFTKMDLMNMITEWADQEITSVVQMSKFNVPKEEHQNTMFEAYDDLTGIFDSMHELAGSLHMPGNSRGSSSLGSELPATSENGSTLAPGSTLSCLVVEDNPVTQRFITAYLEKLQILVGQAFDGNEAVRLCTSNKYDVIFMDISMPIMNGIEATRVIRKTGSLNQFTPIIAFSSYGSQQEYAMHGLDDFLPKPFTRSDLNSMVAKWSPFGATDMSSPANVSSTASRQMMEDPNIASQIQGVSPVATPGVESTSSAGGRRSLSVGVESTGLLVDPTTLIPPANGAKGDEKEGWKEKNMKKAKKNALQGFDLGKFVPKSAKEEVSRMNHNAKERTRRKDISDCVDIFREILPDCNEKTDKVTVLKLAVEYMQELCRQNRKLRDIVTNHGLQTPSMEEENDDDDKAIKKETTIP
eukprot:Nk52_evm16s32 gene=Nk52_evmTU16s32